VLVAIAGFLVAAVGSAAFRSARRGRARQPAAPRPEAPESAAEKESWLPLRHDDERVRGVRSSR
jgi:hypothetical protein